jgi:hypothetical protein
MFPALPATAIAVLTVLWLPCIAVVAPPLALDNDVLVVAEVALQQLPGNEGQRPGLREKLLGHFRNRDAIKASLVTDQQKKQQLQDADAKAAVAQASPPRQSQLPQQPAPAEHRSRMKRLVANCLKGLKGAAAHCFCGDGNAVDRDAMPVRHLRVEQCT